MRPLRKHTRIGFFAAFCALSGCALEISGETETSAASSSSSDQETSVSLTSFLARTVGTSPFSIREESLSYASGTALPSGFRITANYGTDTEYRPAAVLPVSRAGFANCGQSGSITDRIQNCAAVNGSDATWNGESSGQTGEGIWKLVTRVAANKEVWRDERTLLLWSSKIATAINWCTATGKKLDDGMSLMGVVGRPDNITYEDDPADICDDDDPGMGGANDIYPSICVEVPDVTYAAVNEKGNLGTTSTPVITWRAPTRWDYQLAEIHGMRYVLPDFSASQYEWTSTLVQGSANSQEAWAYFTDGGIMTKRMRSVTASMAGRCVGR